MTDTIEAVAREAAATFLEQWDPGPEMTVVKLARAFEAYAANRIATHTKALIEGAGELERFEDGMDVFREPIMEPDPDGTWVRYDQAAATIAALRAENARLTQREVIVREEGVRAGIEAMRRSVEEVESKGLANYYAAALDVAAIAKGV